MAETSTATTTAAPATVSATATDAGAALSIHNDPSTQPSSVSPNTKEDHPKNPPLPPFSFSKRPADEYVLKSRSSTFGEPEGDKSPLFHSHISDIIPSLSRKNTGNTTKNSTSGESTASASKYRDINYDEQIRFPRMNNMNYYTYTGGKRPSYSSNISATSETSSTSENAQKFSEDVSTETDSKYKPAAFDLWQPLRRFSQSIEKETTPKDTKTSLNEDTEENLKLLKEYILNNYIYERNHEQAKLNRKISNFINENGKPKDLSVDTQTSSSDSTKKDGPPSASSISHHPYYSPAKNTRIKNSCVFPTDGTISRRSSKLTRTPSETSSTSIATGVSGTASQSDLASTQIGPTNFNHLYQLKKPLSTPAVLRPMVSKDGTINEESTGSSPTKSLDSRTNPAISNSIYTVKSPVNYGEDFTDAEFLEDVDETMHEEDEHHISIKSIKHTSTGGPSVTLFNVEPTHNHWKPNNYSSHCMQCFKSFGNSLISLLYLFFDGKDQVQESNNNLTNSNANPATPNHRRRHHCRFCGFIYCDSCLIQNDADDAIKHSNPNRLFSTSQGRFMGKGILMDQNARFVVPIYKNLELISSGSSAKSDVSQTSMITDPENFKLFKVCKNCGEIYKNLVLDLNKSAEELPSSGAVSEAASILQKFPFVFIENPYLNTLGEKKAYFPQKSTLDNPVLQSSHALEAERPLAKRKESAPGFSRNNSVNEVPSDWTWSSF